MNYNLPITKLYQDSFRTYKITKIALELKLIY